MKLTHKILLAVVVLAAVIGLVVFHGYQSDRAVEKAIENHYYKWSDQNQRIDFVAEKGQFTINWTQTDSKDQMITNYQYLGSVNATNLDTNRSTKQEYKQTEPQDSVKAVKKNFEIVEYSPEILKIHAKDGNDTKTHTLTSDGVVTVEEQNHSIVQWIIDALAKLLNRITDFF